MLERVAADVWRVRLQPFDLLNAYLLGGVLVDTGGPFSLKKLVAAVAEQEVHAVALTHGHLDHQGGAHAFCARFELPLWCGEGDRAAVESGDPRGILPDPDSWLGRLARRLAGPAHPVARTLREGDEVGGFTVIETPGHTPGHLAFWRAGDRVLVLGDVLFHRNPLTFRRGLQEPFRQFTHDPQRNRRSAQKLAALKPNTICFGHGPPLRDGARFSRFVDDFAA